MSDKYILNDAGEPVKVDDVAVWGQWFQGSAEQRRVALTELAPEIRISTVFLGADHGWRPGEPPILYETLVFGGELDGQMDRYGTRDEAVAGHEAMVERARAALRGDTP